MPAAEAAELARYWLAFRDAAMTMGVIVQRDHRPGYTATLAPGVRAVAPDNPYRRPLSARFVVGLSGNLGFTHDPVIVFEAARLLRVTPRQLGYALQKNRIEVRKF